MVDHPAAPTTDVPLPHHVTTPLLTLITERSMDEDYAHVAARRAANGEPRPTRSKVWSTAVAVAAFGALATIVAVQTSRDADVQELGRDALIRQIEAGREDVADLQGQIRTLTNAGLSADKTNATLAEQSADLEVRLERLEVRTGYVPVRGPGVRIRVDSAPDAVPDDEVRDEDLALLVDGLWTAGAEAIAVNDQRIVALGGIRNTQPRDPHQRQAVDGALRHRGHRRPGDPAGATSRIQRRIEVLQRGQWPRILLCAAECR